MRIWEPVQSSLNGENLRFTNIEKISIPFDAGLCLMKLRVLSIPPLIKICTLLDGDTPQVYYE